MIKAIMLWQVGVAVIGAALWVGSIYVSYPNQLALIWVALGVDLAGGIAYICIMIACQHIGPRASDWFERTFEIYPGKLSPLLTRKTSHLTIICTS